MAKIVINKNFQSKYLYRAYERLVKPDYSINTNVRFAQISQGSTAPADGTTRTAPIQAYLDLSSVYKTTWSGVDTFYDGATPANDKTHLVPHQYFLCDETFLTLLNKINTTAKSGMSSFPKTVNMTDGNVTVTTSNKTANLNIMLLVGSLFSPKKQIRDNAIDYFVQGNFITSSEGTQIKDILSTFNLVDPNVSIDNYGGTYVPKITDISSTYTNGMLDLTINKTLRLDNPYKHTVNTYNRNLYILVIPYCDTKFIDGNYKIVTWFNNKDLNVLNWTNDYTRTNSETATGIVQTGYNTFHNKATNTVVNQIPYIALSITEVGQGGDIEFDHLDEIEYLDEIRISMTLPKEYV